MIESKDCYHAVSQGGYSKGNLYYIYKNDYMVGKQLAESEERAIKLHKREEARNKRISDLIADHISMENAMFKK